MNADTNPFNRHFDHLETLADTIGESLRAPVTIEDAGHRLLAYSKHDPKTDPARIATIIGRRVPENVVGSLWRDGVIPKLMETDEPVRVRSIDEVGLGDRVAVSIRQNGRVLGYIWALEVERKLDDDALHLLKAAAEAAKIKLLRLQSQKRKEDEERRDLFWELLTDRHPSGPQAKTKAESLGIRIPDATAVVVVQFAADVEEALHQSIHYIVTSSRRVRPLLHVVSGSQLIVLTEASAGPRFEADASEFVGSLLRQLGERLANAPLAAGIGSVQEDAAAVGQSYREALALVRIKRQFPAETGAMTFYRELGFYRHLPYLVEQKKLHRYENAALKRLRAYDREHHANLVETLETFLARDGNAKEAADMLHVHANTLAYRLKRIAEIGGIDFGDVDQKITLYLDLKTDKWSGTTERL
ncbi:PucR family transcriptional regulator [Paenibacillus flagellatus]|uniref:PucR family transcriptional regulator n=1 Tax=Paenibacillus flagellatus TaxID=2211139 RepID=A0A2V5KS63_9BACL|nr:helix-turn-helix domain-containing protein [Paenibacillus flagellatus]PYI54407.1 PucR family transcriptional regulator [Paenibacillus flagellatus]